MLKIRKRYKMNSCKQAVLMKLKNIYSIDTEVLLIITLGNIISYY